MAVRLDVRNASAHKRLVQRPALERLAARMCAGEHVRGDAEISLLLCGDAAIRELNAAYRHIDAPTDVLSFPQPDTGTPVRALGDIAISLDTVARRQGHDRAAMRAEVRLLFCHGLLHLLGYDHATSAARRVMVEKQAHYLGIPPREAWIQADAAPPASPDRLLARGGSHHFG